MRSLPRRKLRLTRLLVGLGLAGIGAIMGGCGSTPTELPISTESTVPTVDTAAAPSGWLPLPLGPIQLAAPPGSVLTTKCVPPLGHPPVLVADDVIPEPDCPDPGSAEELPAGQLASTTIDLTNFAPSTPTTGTGEGPIVERRNGVPVLPITSPGGGVGLDVPGFDLALDATGPLASAVLATLTVSPRTVALATGPDPVIPASWRRITFAGVSLAVPGSWTVVRTTRDPNPCRLVLPRQSDHIVLDANRVSDVASCPASSGPRVVEDLQGPTFVQIDAPPSGPTPSTSLPGRCPAIHGVSVCLSPGETDSTGDLTLGADIVLPGSTRAVGLIVGLDPSGMQARTIIRSLREA